MPYVPPDDRERLNISIEVLAEKIAHRAEENLQLREEYIVAMGVVSDALTTLIQQDTGDSWSDRPIFVQVCDKYEDLRSMAASLARVIHDVSKKYGYDGAYLGEFNYAMTRLIQRVPQIKVEREDWNEELRYWIYAVTVSVLNHMYYTTINSPIALSGVFEDIKDEYKRRVNISYEAFQILKNGDCYDTPYYTRLVEVVDEGGRHIGYQEVMLKRSEKTVNANVLKQKIVLRNIV